MKLHHRAKLTNEQVEDMQKQKRWFQTKGYSIGIKLSY